jgi:broad specificity phosphatase PhoE
MHELLLLRHGEVTSHRGDVPVTEAGLATATQVGRRLAARARDGAVRVLDGGTRRTRETAQALAAGASAAGADVVAGGTAHGLRNPDLYLAGVRVDMVADHESYAAQVPGLTAAEVAAVAFFGQWTTSPDRIGWWVAHTDPPGERAADVTRRVERFARSLLDRPAEHLTIGVTHSPVLRALTVHASGTDTGEQAWLAGIRALVADDGTVAFTVLEEAP